MLLTDWKINYCLAAHNKSTAATADYENEAAQADGKIPL